MKSNIERLVFSVAIAVPVNIIAIAILFNNDLRYWPGSVPRSAAPYVGVAMLALSAILLWYGLRNQSNKTETSN